MSHKLIQKKVPKKLNKIHYLLLTIAILAFILNWSDVFLTSQRHNKQLDAMVEEIDYYIEDIILIHKDSESYYNTPDSAVASTNYYFYYDKQEPKKMFVDYAAYEKYDVGDKFPAYTTDHIHYGYSKEALFPNEEYKNNELKKATGVILGIFIICYSIWMRIIISEHKKFSSS